MRWNRLRRRCAQVLLLAIVAVALQIVTPPQASASVNRYSWSFNIAGGAKHNNSLLPANAVINLVANAGSAAPWSIALQEVCNDQYVHLFQALDDYGYNRSRVISDSNDSGCQGESLNNVVFAIGTLTDTFPYTYTVQADSDTQDGRVRKLICVEMNIFAILGACSTHLTASAAHYPNSQSDPRVRHVQSDQAIYSINSEYSGDWRLVGGDFNFGPEETYQIQTTYRPITVWYNAYYEAAGVLTTSGGHTTHGSLKLDYVWMIKSMGSNNPLADESITITYQSQTISDHLMVKGRFLV
jgi:hypothetical protein